MFDPALITSGRLRKVLNDWTCQNAPSLYAIYRKTVRMPPKIAAFLESTAEAFAAFDPDQLTLSHSASVADFLFRANAKSSVPRPRCTRGSAGASRRSPDWTGHEK